MQQKSLIGYYGWLNQAEGKGERSVDTHRTRSMLSYKGRGILLAVVLDELTPCIRHRTSGELYETDAAIVTTQDLSLLDQRWMFRWNEFVAHPEYEVYKLTIRGQNRPEGLICLEIKNDFVFVNLIESAPWNLGSKVQEFVGVGGNLFAIACRRSLQLGFDGFVAFDAKTALIQHYQTTLGAKLIGGQRMFLDTNASLLLVKTYFREGRL